MVIQRGKIIMETTMRKEGTNKLTSIEPSIKTEIYRGSIMKKVL